jgi:hypothetical protein
MYPCFKLYLVSHFKSKRNSAAEQQARASITRATNGTIPVGNIPVKNGSVAEAAGSVMAALAAAAGSAMVATGVVAQKHHPSPGCSSTKVTPLASSSVTVNRSKNGSESEMSDSDSNNASDRAFYCKPGAMFIPRKWLAQAKKDEAHEASENKYTDIGKNTDLDYSDYYTYLYPTLFCSL